MEKIAQLSLGDVLHFSRLRALVQWPQVDQPQRHFTRRVHLLTRQIISNWKTGTKHLVPPDNLIERAIKYRAIEDALYVNSGVNVVERFGSLQLLEKIQALLCKRERRRAISNTRT